MRWALALLALLAVTPLAAQVADKAKTTAAPAKAKPKPKKPLVRKEPAVPAKELFGAVKDAAPLAARAIGFYARGCIAGAKPLAIDGPSWQAMRLSRNRNWGHPQLVRMVEKLATEAKAQDGWNGLLVGDMSQPRGGPMLTGHASHQIGLDADIWLTPMPGHRLTTKEREDLAATSMLSEDKISVDPKVWTPAHAKLIRRAASYPDVERVLVNPAIKKALCEQTTGSERAVLHKIRPYWGHHYHMHIRIACPKGSDNCEAQAPPPSDDGCGKEIDDWIALLSRPPVPAKPDAKPAKPKPPLTLAQLPAECRTVLEIGKSKPATAAKTPATAKQ